MMQQDRQKNEEQDVDLVPVFVWISKGVGNFFRGIGKFFIAIGHAVVLFLVFIQKNIIVIGGFVVLGAALGFYLNVENKTTYSVEARVQPNFKSTQNLKGKVHYFQSLVDQKNFKTLGKELGVKSNVAATLKSFSIKPFYNETELLNEYDKLVKASDTFTIKDFKFENFKEAKRDFDYEYQVIIASGTNTALLNRAIDSIIAIKETTAIKALKAAKQESAAMKLELSKGQIRNIDSVIVASKAALLVGNNGALGSSSNVFMTENSRQNLFQSLFEERQSMLYQLNDAIEDNYKFQNTVNEVSRYTKKGFIEKQHFTLKTTGLFLLLGIIILSIPVFWKALKQYGK